MSEPKCDVHTLELQNLKKEMDEVKEMLKDIEKKHNIDCKELEDKIKEIEDKYIRLEVLIPEYLKGIAEIKESMKTFQKDIMSMIKKILLYFTITICSGLLFLIGMKVVDITALFK